MSDFRKLFEPIRIGTVQLNNRVAMAPMCLTTMLVDRDGSYTQRGIDYYEERAKGGTGLIITGCTHIENEIEPTLNYAVEPIITSNTIPALGELAEAVHCHGTRIFVQLTAGFGRVHYEVKRGLSPVSASENPCYWEERITARALSTEEVERLVAAFGKAAELVAQADIDGIELHGHEGYLLDQFTTSVWNRRVDKYGGSLENRARFPIEALHAIKDRLGSGFPVTYRFGMKHYLSTRKSGSIKREGFTEIGRDVPEGMELARLFEKAGFDALHVDAGCYESWYWPHPPNYQPHGCMLDMANAAKKAVKIPIMAVGRLGVPEIAEAALEQGKADMIVLGRDLLADPFWVQKVREGRVEDIRPCLGCHDACFYRPTYTARPLCCAVNPAVGRERMYALKPTQNPQKIMIAGGGVAGMEAARVAATRGHEVLIFEKSNRLGGHLIEGSVPDFKQDYRKLLLWYVRQLRTLNVEIRLGTEVTPAIVAHEKPDVVIVATGSTGILPNIPGIQLPGVVTCIELLQGKKAGDTVVVVGGGLVGCETALWMAQQGKKVTIVEMLPELAWTPGGMPAVLESNRDMLISLLKENKVRILTNTRIQAITEKGATVIDNNSKSENLICDTVAFAVGVRSERSLYESLAVSSSRAHVIGDANEPRRLMHAIWQAYGLMKEM